MGTIYALMVGINEYASPEFGTLSGCRNDVEAAVELIKQRLDHGFAVDERVLLDGAATGAAIVEGFRTHLAKAGAGDVALFWFSGHGSTFQVPDHYWHLESDGRLETLVCADSRVDGRPELLDKELALLLDEVAEGGAHVVVVLDSCHAGGATREDIWLRKAAPAMQPPAYHLLPDLAERYAAGPPAARHVLLAASHKEEAAAEERRDGDRVYGRFSWALLCALRRAGRGVSYRELVAVARNQVEGRFPRQRPLIYPPGPGAADLQVFGGEALGDPPAILMRHGRDGWEVNAGLAHGVEPGPARFVLDGPSSARLVAVSRAEAARSLVYPYGWTPDPGRAYLLKFRNAARLTLFALAAGLPPLPATFAGDDPRIRLTAEEDAELLLAPAPGGVRLIDRAGDEQIATLAEPPTLGRLHHIARWWRVKSLSNPSSRIAGGVHLEVVEARPDEMVVPRDRPALPPGPDGVLRVAYGTRWGVPAPPSVFLRLRNTTSRPLYCVLLDLTERFKIDGSLFRYGRIEPGGTAAVSSGRPVDFILPADLLSTPGTSYRDWLMVIASTTELHARPYELHTVGPSRDVEPEEGPTAESSGDWWTTVLKVVTTGPS
ncbi:caspase family protein [Dactylosporangium sp. CA-139066]|uniref:caspase family protein n=1 Tax=Dactylosporangium sp. CA-139066 TaxID=3239930 RepID=UPI003D9347A0